MTQHEEKALKRLPKELADAHIVQHTAFPQIAQPRSRQKADGKIRWKNPFLWMELL